MKKKNRNKRKRFCCHLLSGLSSTVSALCSICFPHVHRCR